VKVTEHVEHLLRQGRKPKELIKLGFPKSVVTRVRRQLRKEKATLQPKVLEGTVQAESHPQAVVESPEKVAAIKQKLQSVESDLEKVGNLMKLLPEVTVLMAAAQELGIYKRQNCPYQENGPCTLRTWTSQAEIPQGIGEPVPVGNEEPQYHIKPSHFYCAMCNATLEGRIDELEAEVSANPLSGAEYQITCKGSGNRGWIAVAIKCTKCGRETYWGWWPKTE